MLAMLSPVKPSLHPPLSTLPPPPLSVKPSLPPPVPVKPSLPPPVSVKPSLPPPGSCQTLLPTTSARQTLPPATIVRQTLLPTTSVRQTLPPAMQYPSIPTVVRGHHTTVNRYAMNFYGNNGVEMW